MDSIALDALVANEDEAHEAFHHLMSRFGWVGTVFTPTDVADEVREQFSGMDDVQVQRVVEQVTADRPYQKLADRLAECGSEILIDSIIDHLAVSEDDENEDEDEDTDHSDGDGCAIYDTGYQVHSDGDLDGTVDVEDLEVGDTYNDPAIDAPDEWHSVDDMALVDNGGNDEVHVWTEPTTEPPTGGSEQPSNEEIPGKEIP